MTPEEQRIAIADHCGWKVYEKPITESMGRNLPTACIAQSPNGCERVALPDYAESVSARKAAWEKLTAGQKFALQTEIGMLAARSDEWRSHVALDRWPEAYLRAVGKWKD